MRFRRTSKRTTHWVGFAAIRFHAFSRGTNNGTGLACHYKIRFVKEESRADISQTSWIGIATVGSGAYGCFALGWRALICEIQQGVLTDWARKASTIRIGLTAIAHLTHTVCATLGQLARRIVKTGGANKGTPADGIGQAAIVRLTSHTNTRDGVHIGLA